MGGRVAACIRQELRDRLLQERVIQKREREIFGHAKMNFVAAKRFLFRFDRALEQLQHITPLEFRLHDAALEPGHIEKIVNDAVQAAGAVLNFVGELT